MLKSLKNRRNRKGFTLAELLIVVAIIAVLVAIAVPLFVGQLSKAEESVKNANIRAVRGAAVEIILSDESGKYFKDGLEATGTTEFKGPWYATATVDSNGDISGLKIEATDTASALKDGATGVATKANGKYTVTVKITDLTAS